MCKQQNDRKLRDLGRLYVKARQRNPSAHVLHRRQKQNQYEQEPRNQHNRQRKPMQHVVVDKRDQEHQKHADRRINDLFFDIKVAIAAVLVIRVRITGRKQGHQPDYQNQHAQHEKGHVKTFYCYKCKADRDFQEVRYKDCFETVDGKILYG